MKNADTTVTKTSSTKATGTKTSMLGKLNQHPLVLGILFLIICCFAWLSFLLHHHLMDNTKQDLAMASAQNYAQQQLITTNTYLQQRKQQLQALSEKSLFIDALASGDKTKIEHMEKLMADWVDGLSHGYLLGPEDNRLDKAHNFAGQQISGSSYEFSKNDGVCVQALQAKRCAPRCAIKRCVTQTRNLSVFSIV